MILSRLSNYMREHRRASLADMAIGLDSSPEALEAMLDTLERKGRVKRLPPGSTCGSGCCKCDPTSQVLYQWTGDPQS